MWGKKTRVVRKEEKDPTRTKGTRKVMVDLYSRESIIISRAEQYGVSE